MKLIANNIGRLFIAALAAALVIVLMSSTLLPALRGFVSDVFIDETNYKNTSSESVASTLAIENKSISLPVGSTVDLFSNLIAGDQEGEEIITQLASDYAKPIDQRSQVYVYKRNADNTNTLAAEIDTSGAGRWTVFYLVELEDKNIVLKVVYVVS